MNFRKFAVVMILLVLIFNISSTNAYAAEEETTNKEIESTMEEVKVTSEIESTAEITAVSKEQESTAEVAADNEEQESTAEVTADNKEQESKVEEATIDNKKAKQVVEVETKKYTNSELRLLSAIIYCEAQGESYNGKLAVGIVVMNRKRSNNYPDTVKGVIYQKYQFSPVSNGTFKRALSEYDKGNFTSSAEKECIKAAKAALNGAKSITVKGKKKDFSKYLSFSGRLRGVTYQLENHQFK